MTSFLKLQYKQPNHKQLINFQSHKFLLKQIFSEVNLIQIIQYKFEMKDQRAYLIVNDQRINLYQQTTIGRLSTNLIAINDPTISKNHSTITYIGNDDKFYLKDLSTVNGTYLNGNRLQSNKKYPLKHKDSIQFGKHVNLYSFFMAQPQNQKKGKINLKDYCFQLDSDNEQKQQRISKPSVLNKSNTKPQKNTSNIPKQGKKFKIPNLADYLQLSGSLLSENDKDQKESNQYKISKFSRQGKISLPKVSNDFDEQDLEKVRKEQQYRRNVFLAKQSQKQAREQKARALQQSKIRLQIQKHKHQQEMLKKQYELQTKIREEQQRIENQKRKIQENLLKRQEERRQRQKQLEEQQRQKQRRFVEQLQQQKESQLKMIRNQQQMLRNRNENAMRQQLQRKKKDLQMQAQALANQYQQIYRQTIKKMKNDIQKQEDQIQSLQNNIQSLKEQNISLSNKYQQVVQAVDYAKNQFNQISGRNKAFILYASQLQNKLDRLKSQKKDVKQKRVNNKLKEQISNSRKLLYLKKNEIKTIEDEINKLKIGLAFGAKMGQNDMLQTIISNHHAIQNCKIIYFQYLRQESSLKELWQQELNQNEHLQQQNFALQKQIQNGKKQLISNIKDNISRLTQQRIHMLKCLHYLPEEKKRAAKYLIEEMVTMQQEIKGMIAQSQQSHDKIQELIVDSQRKKQQNEYLSQLLFGSDSTAHHFDNMKIEINNLIDRLSLERDDSRPIKRQKLTEDIQSNQIAIHQNSLKLERMRNRWREGLQGQKMVLAQKNPIVFFGDLLTKRQADLEESNFRISKLQKEYMQVLGEVQQFQRKKQGLGDSLQKFKRQQLLKARQNFM